jgi:hypothetical protein
MYHRLATRSATVRRVEEERKRRWGKGPGCIGCGSGCGGFLVVFILGGALSLFNAAFSLGVSVGVPFTQNNITAAGSIGAKDKAEDALPEYLRGRLGGNQNFINNSTTLTVGPAEGTGILVIGKQDGAPAIDLRIVLR